MVIATSDVAWIGVYPPIGIARVGNASGFDDYTLAAEMVGGLPNARGGLQTTDGAIKRQGVRFRVYAMLRSGGTVELVHGGGIEIEWRVEVANLKAGWYEFNQAMDLPPEYVAPASRRNADHRRRQELDIRPAMRGISGPLQSGPEFSFDDGQFLDRFVTLGELRTDEGGRLLFLGGHGRSAPFYPGMRPITFANNDRWHDDVCDGPVRARVTIGTDVIEADPGYVVVAPPNYAPGITGLVTMDDTVRETFMAAGWLPRPTTTSFSRDIYPIFNRLTGMQWVNHGLLVAHGIGSPLDAGASAVIARLADPGEDNRPWRERVRALFRHPDSPGPESQRQIPYNYGDLFGEARDDNLIYLAVTPTMYAHIERWAAGDFASDWQGPPEVPDFATLPPEAQVAHLTRTGLAECLGGPFHPGIELSWPMRRPELWTLHGAPEGNDRQLYRLRLVPEGEPVRQDYGPQLTREACLAPDGPLAAAGPGALTRWLGVPWQTDEASCNSGADYSPSTYLSIPSFWAARVPEQVLSSAAFAQAGADLIDPFDDPALQRLKHFLYREDWLRDVRGRTYYERIDNMVKLWATLGMVEPVATPPGLRASGAPATSHVETGRDSANAGSDEKRAFIAAIEKLRDKAVAPDAAGLAAPVRPTPPRHRFGQGEI